LVYRAPRHLIYATIGFIVLQRTGFRHSPEWRALSSFCYSGKSRNPGIEKFIIIPWFAEKI